MNRNLAVSVVMAATLFGAVVGCDSGGFVPLAMSAERRALPPGSPAATTIILVHEIGRAHV